MTREGRKFIDPCARLLDIEPGGEDGLAPSLSILVNNVQVGGRATADTPPNFIVKTLVEEGGICYIRPANKWVPFSVIGKKEYNYLPVKIRLKDAMGGAGREIIADGEDYCIFPANAYFYPLKKAIKARVNTIDFAANALKQNINSMKSCKAITYNDKDLTAQIKRANSARLAGRSTVELCVGMGQEISLIDFGGGADSHILEYMEIIKDTREELDQITGRATLGEKTERRINEEVSVIENAAATYIDVMINNINKFAEYYNVNIYAGRGQSLVATPKPAGPAPAQPKTAETANEGAAE